MVKMKIKIIVVIVIGMVLFSGFMLMINSNNFNTNVKINPYSLSAENLKIDYFNLTGKSALYDNVITNPIITHNLPDRQLSEIYRSSSNYSINIYNFVSGKNQFLFNSPKGVNDTLSYYRGSNGIIDSISLFHVSSTNSNFSVIDYFTVNNTYIKSKTFTNTYNMNFNISVVSQINLYNYILYTVVNSSANYAAWINILNNTITYNNTPIAYLGGLWNSPVYIGYNTSMANTNDGGKLNAIFFQVVNNKFEIHIYNYTDSAITGTDSNNMNQFVKELSNGSYMTFGLFHSAPGTSSDYLSFVAYVYPNLAKDTVAYVNNTGSTAFGTTIDDTNYGLHDSSFLYSNDFSAYYNTITNTQYLTNVSWINNVFNTTFFGFEPGQPSSTSIQPSLFYDSNTGYVNAFLADESTNTITVYYTSNISKDYVLGVSANHYILTIKESGLTSGQEWSFKFNNTVYSTSNTEYSLSLLNNSYSLYVYNVSGYSVKYSSAILIDGYNTSTTVVFTPYLQKVYFVISGLPQNTSWAVFINGKQYVSDNVSLIVYLPNGTYNPIFVIPNGYTLNDIGFFSINSTYTYYVQVNQSPFTFLQNNLAYIIVFIFIMTILILAIAVRGRRE